MNNSTSTNTSVNTTAVAAVTYNDGDSFGSFLLVALMALIGGLFIELFNGYNIPPFKCFKGLKTRPLLGKARLP
jgi:hypothetical protein